ncbi:YhgE/Pip domain-containing protein [Clostridium niameyense]|uniref:YhgE/Pip domain-containing protein n=1 Tax=Clostridium niameyense TaxID=1622073 RepID=UPI00067F0B21|nr:YhgE/Pip domain-containing protein [Clostridium niameyense]
MKKVFEVFIKDLKNIFKNWAAIIIFLGLCVLPSLYAWVNIKACWDPYANTGNLPVAVINNDEGTNFKGKEINVGENIVNGLKKNKSIKWQFVDSWQGNYGLNEGKYYALIEIPHNFSNKLVSLTTTTPVKPNIVYKANEKLNAIATKITNVAKDKITKEIKTNFIATVNKESFNFLNQLGVKLQINKPEIVQLKDSLDASNNNLDKIKAHINNANSTSKSLSTFLNDSTNNLPKITNEINNLQANISNNKTLILATKDSINNLGNNLKNDINDIKNINNQINLLMTNVKNLNNNYMSSIDKTKVLNEVNTNIDLLNNKIDIYIKDLALLNKEKPNEAINKAIQLAKGLQTLLIKEKSEINRMNTLINNGNSKDNKENINKLIDEISNTNSDTSNKINNAYGNLYSTLLPIINNISNNLNESIQVTNSILESSKVIVPELSALNTYVSTNANLTSGETKKLSTKLDEFQKQLDKLREKTKNLNGKNLDNIINILKKNPNMVSNFISSPIEVKEEEIYATNIFGVALTPFYSVLGIWVGVLLACALLSVESEEYVDGEKLNFIQRHFGKMLLFLFLSCIQTLIVTIGDKVILGVNPENMPLLIGISLLTSLTFTIMIFTLVSLIGNVGKAIAVVIMVFQIAGSAGIYPIQTNPKIFGLLHPLWPFTYAINGFREAIAGPIWGDVMKNVYALLTFCIVFLLLGLLKKPLHKLNEFMEHEFKESGL